RMIKGDFIVTGPDVEPSKASPAARPETGAPSTIRHRRLKRSAAAVSGQRGSGLPIARGLVGRHVTGNLLNASRPRAVIETVASRRFISAKFRISALSSV